VLWRILPAGLQRAPQWLAQRKVRQGRDRYHRMGKEGAWRPTRQYDAGLLALGATFAGRLTPEQA
jgi:hypothetical protein